MRALYTCSAASQVRTQFCCVCLSQCALNARGKCCVRLYLLIWVSACWSHCPIAGTYTLTPGEALPPLIVQTPPLMLMGLSVRHLQSEQSPSLDVWIVHIMYEQLSVVHSFMRCVLCVVMW